jgi:hypothetical protein
MRWAISWSSAWARANGGTSRRSTNHCLLRDKSGLSDMDAANPRPNSHRVTLADLGPDSRYVVPGSGHLRVSFCSFTSSNSPISSGYISTATRGPRSCYACG